MPRTRVSTTATPITTTVETVVATLPGIAPPLSGTVDLVAMVDLTAGVGTTLLSVNIRRGTTTAGALVQSVASAAPAASARGLLTIVASDTQNVDVSGQQYVVTITQTGATGNGTANYATLRADY